MGYRIAVPGRAATGRRALRLLGSTARTALLDGRGPSHRPGPDVIELELVGGAADAAALEGELAPASTRAAEKGGRGASDDLHAQEARSRAPGAAFPQASRRASRLVVKSCQERSAGNRGVRETDRFTIVVRPDELTISNNEGPTRAARRAGEPILPGRFPRSGDRGRPCAPSRSPVFPRGPSPRGRRTMWLGRSGSGGGHELEGSPRPRRR